MSLLVCACTTRALDAAIDTRVWRARQTQKVTHQGSPEALAAFIVAPTLTTIPSHHADHTVVAPSPAESGDRAVVFRIQVPLDTPA